MGNRTTPPDSLSAALREEADSWDRVHNGLTTTRLVRLLREAAEALDQIPPANVLTGEGARQAHIVASVRSDLLRYSASGRLHPVQTLHAIAQNVGYYLARRS